MVCDASGNPLRKTGIRGVFDNSDTRLSTVLYCAALVVWVTMTLLDQTYYGALYAGTVHKVIRVACLAILAVAEIIDWKDRGVSTRSIVAFALTCILIIIVLFANMRIQVDAILLVCCVRNRTIVVVGKVLLVTLVVVLLFVVASSFLGIIENTVVQSRRNRSYLGFRYALYPAACLFSITLLSLCLSGRSFIIPTVLLLAVANVTMFMYTDSRLSCALALVATLFSLVVYLRGGKFLLSRPMGVMFCTCFVLAAVVSVFLTVAYSSDSLLMESLNSFLGRRLEYGQRALETYGIPVLGQDVEFVGAGLSMLGTRKGGDYFYLDNIYLRILVEYGVVAFAFYLLGYTVCMYRAWKSGNAVLMIALLALALHGMVDNLMLYLWYCPFLLLLGQLFRDRDTKTVLVQIGRR